LTMASVDAVMSGFGRSSRAFLHGPKYTRAFIAHIPVVVNRPRIADALPPGELWPVVDYEDSKKAAAYAEAVADGAGQTPLQKERSLTIYTCD